MGGATGQLVLPTGARQTSPVKTAFAREIIGVAYKPDITSSGISIRTKVLLNESTFLLRRFREFPLIYVLGKALSRLVLDHRFFFQTWAFEFVLRCRAKTNTDYRPFFLVS